MTSESSAMPTLRGDVEGAHWDALRSLLPAYRQLTRVSVKDDASTSFWEDRWIGDQPLCSAFPTLYSHVAHHGASVQATASRGLENFLVPRLTRQAQAELRSVREILGSWSPLPGSDEQECRLQTVDRKLITAMIYRHAIAIGSSCDYYGFVWQNHAPPKFKFFAWLLLQDRIQCKTNLRQKHVLDSDTCEVCHNSPESVDHLIAGCSFSKSFWAHVGWDPSLIPPVTQLWTVRSQAGAPAESLPTMFLLCCWQLWLHRHGVVFRAKPPSLQHLLLECQSVAKTWRCRLLASQQRDADYWSTLFTM